MKRGDGGTLVEIETGYEKAISRSRLSVERNASLLEVTVPIGVIRSLSTVRSLSPLRSARGSTPVLRAMPEPEPPTSLRGIELMLMAAIILVFVASLAVAVT
jgi:hypothetical protein